MQRVVVVGADAAGMSAAHAALRGARVRRRDISVVVLEATQHTSYSACGIPYWIAGDVDDSTRLLARSAGQHREMGVDLRMGARATSLDLPRRVVRYRDERGAEAQVPFDDLVLATGAPAMLPPWALGPDGHPVTRVHPVKNLDDGAVWLDLLLPGGLGTAQGCDVGRRAVVVGGGYIGVEMAEALIRRGLRSTLLTRGRVMSSLDPDMSDRVEKALQDAGVDVLTGTEVAALTLGLAGAVTSVTTTDGRGSRR